MEWYDNRNPIDPLAACGQYRCDQDWLDNCFYQVSKGGEKYLWHATFFVHNGGEEVFDGNHSGLQFPYNGYKTLDDAKDGCRQHRINLKNNIEKAIKGD